MSSRPTGPPPGTIVVCDKGLPGPENDAFFTDLVGLEQHRARGRAVLSARIVQRLPALNTVIARGGSVWTWVHAVVDSSRLRARKRRPRSGRAQSPVLLTGGNRHGVTQPIPLIDAIAPVSARCDGSSNAPGWAGPVACRSSNCLIT